MYYILISDLSTFKNDVDVYENRGDRLPKDSARLVWILLLMIAFEKF